MAGWNRKLMVVAVVGLTVAATAQWRRGRGRGYDGDDGVRTARAYQSRSTGTPTWTNAPGFERDVFTFARVRYDYGGWRGGGWRTDLPDSDLNLSWRLQQMTSMKVDPDGRLISLTDAELKDYPFLYIVEPGGLSLSDAEVLALRNYLLNGGFLMLDDFWGEYEWANCEEVMRRVFPERSFQEIPLDHALYQRPFRITAKHQVPNIDVGASSQWTQVTWEMRETDTREVHHRAIYDDQGRMMVAAFHNTDNGDGWEREGEDPYYFTHFSEKTAYPLAINVLFYVMTH